MEHQKQLEHIEKLMTRSTRFLSLSGLSGVAAGIIAIIGAVIARSLVFTYVTSEHGHYGARSGSSEGLTNELLIQLAGIAVAVLVLSACAAFYFSNKRAKKMGASLFDQSAWHLLRAFIPAMLVGAFFCAFFLQQGMWGHYDFFRLIIPSTLIFYGLALWNASKFTMDEIFYLGISEILLGAVCLFLWEYSFYFWTLGFGVLHILYGAAMYFKYERIKA